MDVLPSVLPDDNNGRWQDLSTLGTNDHWAHPVYVFDNTATKDEAHGSFTVPKNYVGTANIIPVWSTTATSGDVEWDFEYRAVGGNDTESLDQATAQESVNSNDTAPSAAHERMEISISLTDGNFAADDTVQFRIGRDGTDAGDTIAAAVYLVGLLFEYADA
jgi:hypothetical protein